MGVSFTYHFWSVSGVTCMMTVERTTVAAVLVSAATYILGPFGPDTDLRRYGKRIAATGSQAARAKARIAVARKLAILLHRLWITGEVYQPLKTSKPTKSMAN